MGQLTTFCVFLPFVNRGPCANLLLHLSHGGHQSRPRSPCGLAGKQAPHPTVFLWHNANRQDYQSLLQGHLRDWWSDTANHLHVPRNVLYLRVNLDCDHSKHPSLCGGYNTASNFVLLCPGNLTGLNTFEGGFGYLLNALKECFKNQIDLVTNCVLLCGFLSYFSSLLASSKTESNFP